MTPQDVPYDFAANMRRFRLAANLTQADLANEMGLLGLPMHQVTVGKMESAARPIAVVEVAALAEIFNVEIAELLKPNPPCSLCRNEPPGGYRCLTCGRSS